MLFNSNSSANHSIAFNFLPTESSQTNLIFGLIIAKGMSGKPHPVHKSNILILP